MNLGLHTSEEALKLLKEEETALEARLEFVRAKESQLEALIERIHLQRVSRGRPLLSTLPPELLSQIVAYLPPQASTPCETCATPLCYHCDRPCERYSSLSLVSKHLRSHVEPLLYREIIIPRGRNQPFPTSSVDNLIRTLRARPDLRQLVKLLIIADAGHVDYDLIDLCKALERAHFPALGHALRAAKWCSETLSTLLLTNGIYASSLCAVLEALPNLREIRFKLADNHTSYSLFSEALHQAILGSTSLESLDGYVNIDIRPYFPTILMSLGQFPRLKRLTLTSGSSIIDPSVNVVNTEKLAKCRFEELYLPQADFLSSSGSGTWLASVGQNLEHLTHLKTLHLTYSADVGFEEAVPERAFALFPPGFRKLVFATDRYEEVGPPAAEFFTSVVNAWAHRKVAGVEAELDSENAAVRAAVERFARDCERDDVDWSMKDVDAKRKDDGWICERVTIHFAIP